MIYIYIYIQVLFTQLLMINGVLINEEWDILYKLCFTQLLMSYAWIIDHFLTRMILLNRFLEWLNPHQ